MAGPKLQGQTGREGARLGDGTFGQEAPSGVRAPLSW